MATTNVLIVGVGGQGVLLAGTLLSKIALDAGLDVKQSEVHGMSQRGGSVSSHVRFGERVYSSLIEDGTVDVLLAFEKLEALRYGHMVRKKKGVALVNDQRIDPSPVAIGLAEYPEGRIFPELEAQAAKVIKIDGLGLAKEAGFPGAVNVVLLGAASGFLPFTDEQWTEAIRSTVKGKYVDINLKAFELGRAAVS
jgi:indolepyruvate ferredoxin oxidoreductase beta subunit